MTGKECIHKIQRHPAVTAVVPLEEGLQWPAFTMEHGKLCAQVYFCHTRLDGAFLRIDPPRYVCKLSYPFEHIILLEDLAYREGLLKQPGWLALPKENVSALLEQSQGLFHSLDQLLKQYAEKKSVDRVVWEEYHARLVQIVPPEHLTFYFQKERMV